MKRAVCIAVCALTLAFLAWVFVFPIVSPHLSLSDSNSSNLSLSDSDRLRASDPAPLEIKKAAPDYARILERFAGEDVTRVPVKEKIIALSFDGGGNAAGTEKILAALAEFRIPATFFITGAFVEKFPQVMDALAGYEIAHHSLSHRDMTARTEDEFTHEIKALPELLCARRPAGICRPLAPFFRFPYGARNAEAIARVNAMGYTAVRWTVDSLGWQGRAPGRDARFVADRVTGKAEPGAIVLMHLGSAKDGSTLDADALPDIIRALSSQGYRFVAIFELFASAL